MEANISSLGLKNYLGCKLSAHLSATTPTVEWMKGVAAKTTTLHPKQKETC